MAWEHMFLAHLVSLGPRRVTLVTPLPLPGTITSRPIWSRGTKTPQTFSMLIDYGFNRGNSEVATHPNRASGLLSPSILINLVFFDASFVFLVARIWGILYRLHKDFLRICAAFIHTYFDHNSSTQSTAIILFGVLDQSVISLLSIINFLYRFNSLVL
jgi:hypothetical protein